MTRGAKVEAFLALDGRRLHGGVFVGEEQTHFLKVVRVEIVFGELSGIMGGKDLHFDDVTAVYSLS